MLTTIFQVCFRDNSSFLDGIFSKLLLPVYLGFEVRRSKVMVGGGICRPGRCASSSKPHLLLNVCHEAAEI